MAFVKLADNYTDLIGKFAVALLAEGVDRNLSQNGRSLSSSVALLAEGVGRKSNQEAAPPVPLSRPPPGGGGEK